MKCFKPWGTLIFQGFLLLLTGCSGGFHFENDILGSLQTKDKYYTQGTQFDYIKETKDEKQVYSLGQTIYTPSVKKPGADPEVLKNDRPYTGWLYLEYRKTAFTSETIKDTYGIQVGCSGPCSFAKETQQWFHKLIDQGIPTWDPNFALKNEPGFILELERSYLLHKSEYFDASTYGALKAGNIIDSAAFGVDFRAGYNLDKFSAAPIIFKFPQEEKSPWTAYLFARAEERVIAYNHFLDGSLFQDERHTVTSEVSVQEGDVGITLGYKSFKLTYRYTIFSNEWKETKGSFSFGGVSFEW